MVWCGVVGEVDRGLEVQRRCCCEIKFPTILEGTGMGGAVDCTTAGRRFEKKRVVGREGCQEKVGE